jgi:hypothetical protein
MYAPEVKNGGDQRCEHVTYPSSVGLPEHFFGQNNH